jgi:hypothetical protein
VADVESGSFPDESESYQASDEVAAELLKERRSGS